ncbi:ABC transporter substrate-binding protein [Ferrovibrio sp.]|uniref:substrate-binding periplasmic protein n=1 Tax=Ferrovibrio sp. TaxID=1917215 RepID=UPI0026343A85|nr:transporter substrate-binding domain-containing protein [Ferrovibrio sp.]
MRGIAIILASVLSLPAGQAAAQAGLQIVAPARPPYIVDQDGIATGPAVELTQQLARSIRIDSTVRILPFQRAVMALDKGDTLYPALLRTPQREKRYVWIGEVYVDRAVFFTRNDRNTINSIDTARALPVISVMRGSELQSILQSLGLEQLEANATEIDNARLLQAGRIDGWFALEAVGRATWRGLDFNPVELRSGEPFALLSFWIAGSANLPADTVVKLRAAYRAMRADGRYQRIIAPLAALSAPS